MTCPASGSSGRILPGWQGVAEGSTPAFEEKCVFSHWRPLIYILYTLENLAGYCLALLAGTATATVIVFVLQNVRLRQVPEFVDGVAVMPPIEQVLGFFSTTRFLRDAPRIHCAVISKSTKSKHAVDRP